MSPVILVVVVGKPVPVGVRQLGPGLGLSEVPIGHPPLDVEVGFDIGLPRLARIDPPVVDPECCIDGLGVGRLEDAPAVAH